MKWSALNITNSIFIYTGTKTNALADWRFFFLKKVSALIILAQVSQ